MTNNQYRESKRDGSLMMVEKNQGKRCNFSQSELTIFGKKGTSLLWEKGDISTLEKRGHFYFGLTLAGGYLWMVITNNSEMVFTADIMIKILVEES